MRDVFLHFKLPHSTIGERAGVASSMLPIARQVAIVWHYEFEQFSPSLSLSIYLSISNSLYLSFSLSLDIAHCVQIIIIPI